MTKIKNTSHNRGYQELEGQENGEFLFNGDQVSVSGDENVLETDSGNGCRNTELLTAPE